MRKIFWKKFNKGILILAMISLPVLACSSTLSVEISANPSSGFAPLEDVDLTATVSGTVTGDITYKFDCENDGSWEKIITTSETSFTAYDLCDYPSPGSYVAKVVVERGGLVFEGTTPILVKGGADFSVQLSANPSSGAAPLNDVDLTASVSGSVSGEITYKFDCTSDGTWEKEITTSETSYTAYDLCDYPSVGNYTAKVKVERGGLSAEATTGILVQSKVLSFSVKKIVRNLSDGTGWADTVFADPGEVIEIKIEVRAGEKTLDKVTVKDNLPDKMRLMEGSLKVNGTAKSGNILDGVDIGKIGSHQKKTVTFRAYLLGSDQFAFGETKLVNEAIVTANGKTVSDTATITVRKTGVLAAATGFETKIFFQFLALPLIGAVLSLIVLKPYLIEFEDWLRVKNRDYREMVARKLLQMKIAKIKKKKI